MATKTYGGRWPVIKQLTSGGQGDIFLVKDAAQQSDAQYILKRLRNLSRLNRFRREVEALRAIDHPNILKVVDADLDGAKPYIVSAYHTRGALDKNRAFWEGDRLRAVELFIKVCNAVAAAHERGILHRDIKPSNVLISDEGEPIVADFGICLVEDDERLTMTDEAVGPRLFMAPELEDGRADPLDPTCDVYSLGKLLYWMLSSRLFNREKHRDERHDLVRIYGDGSYEHANRLLDRMVVADPRDRLADASIVAQEAHTLARLWRHGYNPVSSRIPQLCYYCGIGTYQLVARTHQQAGNMGYNRITGEWRILVCGECGHMQTFRLDLAKGTRGRDWWNDQPEKARRSTT